LRPAFNNSGLKLFFGYNSFFSKKEDEEHGWRIRRKKEDEEE
jgi:hypothetical protein